MHTKTLIVICFFLSMTNLTFAGIKEDTAKTIVRVKSGNKYSTGFFWKNGNTILATLHSMGDYNDITIYVSNSRIWKKAKVKNVYKSADLVLLNIINFNSVYFLDKSYSSKPSVDTKSFTVGYNSDNGSYQDKDLTVGLLQGSTLGDLLPNSASKQITTLGFPSLNIEIVYLKGSLLHGFSGAPILDFQGKLIGVADGGLENGAADISWCINAKHLVRLESSIENLPILNHSTINTLFAEDLDNNNTEIISLGDFQFKKVKTRTFSQMDKTGFYSTTKELGLFQLIAMFEKSGFNYNDFSYDIYIEEKSGATVVIPSDLKLTEENGFLTAKSENSDFKYYIKAMNTTDVQKTCLDFEYRIMAIINTYNWTTDQRLSFSGPLLRYDGAIINRKAYYTLDTAKYGFEILAAKQNYFLGLFVEINNQFNLNTALFNDMEEVAKYNLAMNLTTFSN